jgi:hypothetical protein
LYLQKSRILALYKSDNQDSTLVAASGSDSEASDAEETAGISWDDHKVNGWTFGEHEITLPEAPWIETSRKSAMKPYTRYPSKYTTFEAVESNKPPKS